MTGELRSGRLAGKRALVTGAAAGLGKAIAHRFAEEGARVVVVDIQEQASHQVVESIRQQGGEAHAVVGDVGSSSQVERIVSATHSLLEGIDILVNNAGVIPSRETVVDTREEDWDKTLRVNAKGVFLMSRSVIPGMIRQGGGTIVNMSSVAGLVGLPIRPAYGASKGAVSILTRQMAVDFGKHNVRVNAINPSFVITDLNREMFRRLKEDAAAWTEMIQQHPLGRLGEPGDVADAAVYLAFRRGALGHGSPAPSGRGIHRALTISARGKSRRGIRPGLHRARTALPPRSHTPGMLPQSALSGGRSPGLGATRDFHHGLITIQALGVCAAGSSARRNTNASRRCRNQAGDLPACLPEGHRLDVGPFQSGWIPGKRDGTKLLLSRPLGIGPHG